MITSVEDWERFAPPKSPHQWVVGRSAFELARAWCHTGSPAAPNVMRALFETLADTRGLVIDCVMPELQIRFDAHRGEPRNADLAFIGNTANARWAVTVEAKADEPFGATVAETAADALERSIENSRSKGLQRVGDLVRALFHPRTNGAPEAGSLRYQLLTASAGSLAFAVQEQASSAILIVHEFMTDKTNDVRHTKNGADYRAFLHRLAGHPVVDDQTALHGPFTVPGTPLFEKPPRLFVGKIVTNRRTANDREAHG